MDDIKNRDLLLKGLNIKEQSYMFDPTLLEELNWNEKTTNFKNNVSIQNPGKNLKLRPLSIDDYEKGFTKLLSQLTTVGEITQEMFYETFNSLKSTLNTYFILVIEDIENNKIVATASVLIEQKFIHECAIRSRIEDVVVDVEYRGRQLGKLLVESGVLLSKKLGCYKSSLECKEENVKFYEMLGFNTDNIYMVNRF